MAPRKNKEKSPTSESPVPKGKVKSTSQASSGDITGSSSDPSRLSPAEVLGQAAWLLSQSPKHKYLYLADIEWAILPALNLRQFKLYRKEGTTVPVALAIWAQLSPQAEARYLETRRLQPQEWNSGDRLHIVDVIAPFGGAEAVMQDLAKRK
jgi:cytolysin-activating lysine-acyltransferase